MGEILSLDKIKSIEFEILKHLKKICEEENIQFFLSNGTLLGAIKYKGFIPWDDDIDIMIPRRDYNRLIQLYQDSSQYRLFSNERNKNYRYPFAKLCDMSTIKEEINIDNGVILGLDIDIFPLDIWPNEKKDAEKQVKNILNKIKILNFSKLKFNQGKTKTRTILKMLAILIARVYGSHRVIKKIQQNSCDNLKNNFSKYCGCVVWPIYGEKEIIPSKVFDRTIEVEFEGEMFPAPIGYDTYLRSLYGDYKKDPPLEKQKTHHRFKAYRNDEI